MKKQTISFLLCATMVISSGIMAFGADVSTEVSGTETKPVIAANMTFTGTPIKMSLADTIKRMQTEGVQAETLKSNDLKDKSVADGYSEAVINMHKEWDSIKENPSSGMGMVSSQYTTIDEKSKKLSRDFAKANLENNHQAELNSIEQTAVKMYYSVLLAQDNVTAAKDNLSIQNSILANVQKKFNAGVAAKKDVLSAKTEVTDAESKLKTAEVALNNAKMNFNVMMAYPLLQNVVLTDTLKELAAPTTTLTEAINNAMTNRMEPKDAALTAQIQEIILNNLKLTVATNSATYLRQQVAYLQAKQAADNAPIKMEQDIRSQYMGLEEKTAALKSAKETVAFTKESFRLAQISYDAGVNTLTDVQSAQLAAFRANQGLAAVIQEYNLAIYDYKYAQGVGTSRVAL